MSPVPLPRGVTGWTRRDVLRAAGVASAVGLAGCLDSSGPDDRPVTGERAPELATIEETVRSFLRERDVPGAVLGITASGETLLERGYGYRDADRTDPMTPETLFRIASLSKAFTRAAIRRLASEGRLSMDQPVVPLLDLDPLPGETQADRLAEITVRHLLEHRGGWDRSTALDPMFSQLDIALERGWTEPPGKYRLARHMLSQPLQFPPGEQVAYSNFGYSLLGQVVEAVTGESYQDYVEGALLEPQDITDVRLGRSLPADRPDRETWYTDEMACRNVIDVRPHELVRCPDGGFHLEATDASGGHVATVSAFLRFMDSFWLDGRPRDDSVRSLSFTGTLPGTFTVAMHHPVGVDVALFCNRRGYDPNYHRLRTELREAVGAVEMWPAAVEV